MLALCGLPTTSPMMPSPAHASLLVTTQQVWPRRPQLSLSSIEVWPPQLTLLLLRSCLAPEPYTPLTTNRMKKLNTGARVKHVSS